MKKFSSYKDCEIQWSPQVPSHWRVERIKHLFTEKRSKSNHNLNSGSISFGEVIYKDDESIPISTKESYQELLEGEFLINPLNLNYDLKSLRIGLSRINVVVSQGYIILINTSQNSSEFLRYLLREFDIRHIKSLGNGVRQTISFKHLSNEHLPVPPLSEQQQIVTFLDIKTLYIDSLIEKTQRKIELLKEKRTSLINEVVTKGLNPNVEMKDSGVEWIGEIPSGWEVLKLKYFCDLINEKGTPNNDDIKISPENVESNTGVCFNLYSEYSGEGVKFIEHDILLNKLRLYLKKVLFSEFEGFSMGEMIVLRIRMGVPKFYFRTLFHQGLIDVLDNQSTGVKLPRVSPELIMNTNFPVPPISEQNEIISYLDEHTQLIDKTISVEQRRIDTLKEYRQSLISEVVTGKIDVCQDNGIPWFQKPVPKVTIHKFETPINGREAIISTVQPIWGKDVYDIVLDNLEIVNSLFTSDLQFELISKYLIPVGKDPDDCYFLLKDNSICGIFYFKNYYESHNEDYSFRPEGTLFEIVGTEIEISTTERITHWVFNDLMKKGFSSFLLYYKKSYGRTSSDDVLTFKKIKEKLSNG